MTKAGPRDSPVIQRSGLHLPVRGGVWVWSLVGELRALPALQRKNQDINSQGNIVTHAGKTFPR